MSNLSLQQLAAALGGKVISGDRVVAPGPGHSAGDRSMVVKLDGDDYVVHSFAGNDWKACRDYIDEKIGAPKWEPQKQSEHPIEAMIAMKRKSEQESDVSANDKIIRMPERASAGRIVATYDYTDLHGALLYQTVRYEPKDFRARQPGANGEWIWKFHERSVLYRWPDLIKHPSATVFVCEGEKDADRLASLGYCAVSPDGRKRWSEECVEALKGRDLFILEDNDDPGRQRALAAAVAAHGSAASVRVVRLPNLRDGGDVSDWLNADPSHAGTLVDICRSTPEWSPNAEEAPLPPLTIAEWKGREDLAEPDFLLGHFLTTTSRLLLTATTGLGKTNFCMAVAIRIAAKLGFLHWRARRRARVLYIDGEMSRRLFRERIEYECARAGVEPDTVFFLSKEDVEGMPPLNTPEGQAYIYAFIKRIGGVDLIIFDNIMCLLIGDMKDPAPWQAVANWTKSLTKRCIGQIWVHHTGHDETRSYGDKSKEWALDTTIHLDAKKRDDTDVSFTLKFGKARERTPATRDDFRDIDICLLDDEWTHEAAVIEKKKPAGWTKGLKLVRHSIDEAILAHGFKHRARGDGPEVAAVALKHARNAHKKIYVNTGDDEATGAERQAWSSNFKKARSSDLVGGETLADGREIIWIVREN